VRLKPLTARAECACIPAELALAMNRDVKLVVNSLHHTLPFWTSPAMVREYHSHSAPRKYRTCFTRDRSVYADQSALAVCNCRVSAQAARTTRVWLADQTTSQTRRSENQ